MTTYQRGRREEIRKIFLLMIGTYFLTVLVILAGAYNIGFELSIVDAAQYALFLDILVWVPLLVER